MSNYYVPRRGHLKTVTVKSLQLKEAFGFAGAWSEMSGLAATCSTELTLRGVKLKLS